MVLVVASFPRDLAGKPAAARNPPIPRVHRGASAFSQTDFTGDLKKITVPVLVMHGDDDQIVPYADSGPLSAKLGPDSSPRAPRR